MLARCTRSWKALGILLVLPLALAIFTQPASLKRDNQGFVPLFNGKDLSGWSGDPDLWSVQNGEIVGNTEAKKIEKNSFLSTPRHYADFVLRIKVKLRNGNSGVQFRSERSPEHVVGGYQADIAEKNYFGMLYEERGRGILPYWKELTQEQREAIHGAAKQSDWNQYEITCQGTRVKMVLNGVETLDLDDPAGAREGFIALQLHVGDPMEVRFKDIEIKELPTDKNALLMPEFDKTRSERIGLDGERFRVPSGFSVEEVAPHDLTTSVINLTFDHLGRPVVGHEKEGVRILTDTDNDGKYDSQINFCEEVKRPMGLYFIAPGDMLVQAEGSEGPGLYRLTDTDADDKADTVTLLRKSDGGMGEHGPHAIVMGPDGYYYIIYGNHAHPIGDSSPSSPARDLAEDYLLPRYVDPRGHANSVMAPGGTIHRVSPDLETWEQVVAGFRNAYDFSIDLSGEMFTFDSDMEWDVGLPWFRPVRAIHCAPGGDYGWRTGSSKKPFYYLDTLPSLADVGRGSPVGTCIYQADIYPERYRGAFFMGDWSRGRIRVVLPEPAGASFTGDSLDFVVGEPLNVTDLDVGPDGLLYFTVGGRGTQGGLFRVNYSNPEPSTEPASPLLAVLDQPMPRSAWGKKALREAKAAMGNAWESELTKAARDRKNSPELRLRALEALQVLGPQPDESLLTKLAKDKSPEVRATAVYLLGTFPHDDVRKPLVKALGDKDALVARRAADALVRTGLNPDMRIRSSNSLVKRLLANLDRDDRHVRYASRLALTRVDRAAWSDAVLSDDITKRPHGAVEGLLALVMTHETVEEADAVFGQLASYAPAQMDDAVLIDYLRVIQMAYIRDAAKDDEGASRAAFAAEVGPHLLPRFPSANLDLNRELQIMVAHMQTPGAINALLAYATEDKPQKEQIHTIYCLRTITDGWTADQRTALVHWFDRGRDMAGAASMAGYINNLWESSLTILPEGERQVAEARKANALAQREAEALALVAAMDDGKKSAKSDLAQMSFQELSEYLEYDPMSYRADLNRGKRVFIKSRCASCHVFGSVGTGGGPDLSTVSSRFRRKDILESIMYPSKVVSDQYTGVDLVLDDFTNIIGMVAGENDAQLTVITIDGERIDVDKSKIMTREEAKGSVMPPGLMYTMDLGDLVALINYLEKGSDMK
jgi:putative membrane-bound dehydrogenase-like protein